MESIGVSVVEKYSFEEVIYSTSVVVRCQLKGHGHIYILKKLHLIYINNINSFE